MSNKLSKITTGRFNLGQLIRSAVVLSVVATFGFITVAPQVAWAQLSPGQLKIYRDDIDYLVEQDKLCQPGAGAVAANLTVGKDFNLGDPANGALRRTNLMKALMADFGFTAEQAAGIVGNFMQESGSPDLPPDVNEGGAKGPPAFSGGYGWAQWTGPRQRAFIDFATAPANGYMAAGAPATDAANYAWLKQELGNEYKTTVEAVRATTTVNEAVIAFEDNYEKAGAPNIPARQAFAAQALQEYNGGGTPAAPGGTPAGGGGGPAGGCGNTAGNNGAAIVGDTAFPLKTTKAGVLNRNIFANGTTNRAGHPYTAYDILANPGTEVVAFMSGTVTTITTDKCPGRMISVYNAESNMTISYLHLSKDPATHVAMGATVEVGAHIGVVGTTEEGCTVPHLHIDAAQGDTRPGCARENCPAANAAKFVDIGPQLFETYQVLPD